MADKPIIEAIQLLEPGIRVKLVEVNAEEFGGSVMRFHNYNIPHTEEELKEYERQGVTEIPPKTITWQGEEYFAWPYELAGIEWDGTGQSPQPTLEVANLDGTISAMCLQLQNLFGAKVTEHTTFEQYLPTGADPDPMMEFTQTWYVTRKSAESQAGVTFELSSPADFIGQKLPRRLIHGLCHWALNNGYRGPDCGYTDARYFTDLDEPTDNPVLDVCPGLYKSCKIRFGEENPLPFGGFIASSFLG